MGSCGSVIQSQGTSGLVPEVLSPVQSLFQAHRRLQISRPGSVIVSHSGPSALVPAQPLLFPHKPHRDLHCNVWHIAHMSVSSSRGPLSAFSFSAASGSPYSCCIPTYPGHFPVQDPSRLLARRKGSAVRWGLMGAALPCLADPSQYTKKCNIQKTIEKERKYHSSFLLRATLWHI